MPENTRADLRTRADIQILVDAFYEKVRHSEIGFFFDEIRAVDWAHHLPKMYDFWESLLLAGRTYKGNPMAAHFPINEVVPMEKRHFQTWLGLWVQTVRENFQGEVAELAIYKATNISQLMAFRMAAAQR